MATVVPTVLATTPDEYRERLGRARALSARIHVDISDGTMTEAMTIGLAQMYVPDGTILDLHLMIKQPRAVLETALSMQPRLIIVHAETEAAADCLAQIAELGVKAGLAILPETAVESVSELIKAADHVLIFTGHLGFNGGTFQVDQLEKVAAVRAIKPALEISVDGGVDESNARKIAQQDVNVLYVGAAIQFVKDPQVAFDAMSRRAVVAAQ